MISIVPYRNSWVAEFELLGAELEKALGSLALAIHHIGSTSVPGLSAKDIIDIQVTVQSFDAELERRLRDTGFEKRAEISEDHRPPGRFDIPQKELHKEFYQRAKPDVNLHVRVQGYYNQRYPLLCRDYLRTHPDAASAYQLVKVNLAKHFSNDMDAYYEIKDPVFDIIMAGAEAWAVKTNWVPDGSDIA